MARCKLFAFGVAAVVLATGSARASFVSAMPDAFVNSDLVPDGRVDTGAAGLGFLTYTVTNVVRTELEVIPNTPASVIADYTAVPVLTFFATATSSVPTGSASLDGQFSVTATPGGGYGSAPGIYNLQLMTSVATGTINGLPVVVRLRATGSPLLVNGGQTTITAGPAGQFAVTTGLTQYSEYSIGGGPFLPLPPIQSAGVQAVPEPTGLAAVGLAATAAGLLRRRGDRRR